MPAPTSPSPNGSASAFPWSTTPASPGPAGSIRALKGELWRARQDGAAPREWPIRRWVARDFIAGCPDLAVVDSRGGINYVAVLVASEADFAEAWAHYH